MKRGIAGYFCKTVCPPGINFSFARRAYGIVEKVSIKSFQLNEKIPSTIPYFTDSLASIQ
jgi:hypothetical protein